MCGAQYLASAFTDDDAGGHRVASCYARHDRPVCDAKVFDSINFTTAVHNRHVVSPHLGGACLMPVVLDGIADEVFELRTFQGPWHHLAPGEWPERGGVADLAAQFDASYYRSQIVWMRQEISVNLNRIERIGSSQSDAASAFRPGDRTGQCPTSGRKAKGCCSLWTCQWHFHLTRL